MAEEASNVSEHHPSFGRRLLSKFSSLSGWGERKEHIPQSTWWEKAIDGMEPSDKKTMQDLRTFFGLRGESQIWYYSGAGVDVSPTFIAPPNTKHWMVDVGYDSSHHFHHHDYPQSLSEPYEKLGATVQTATSWEEGWRIKRQTVTIDGKTKLELVGGDSYDQTTAPDSVDVIYSNPYSPYPSPDALIALKSGGYLLIGNSDEDGTTKTRLVALNKPIEDFDIRKVGTFYVSSLHFPLAGKTAGTMDEKPTWFQVYKKSRPFTPEEEDILQLDASLWEIECKLDDCFIFYASNTGEQLNIYEDLLAVAFKRYFDKIRNLKGDSQMLAQNVQTHMDNYYFSSDLSSAKYLETGDFPQNLSRDQILSYLQKVAEIYKNIRNRT